MFHVKRWSDYRKNTSTRTANLDISESPKRGELSGNSIQFTVAGYQKREPRRSEVPSNSVLARLCVADFEAARSVSAVSAEALFISWRRCVSYWSFSFRRSPNSSSSIRGSSSARGTRASPFRRRRISSARRSSSSVSFFFSCSTLVASREIPCSGLTEAGTVRRSSGRP